MSREQLKEKVEQDMETMDKYERSLAENLNSIDKLCGIIDELEEAKAELRKLKE